MKSIEEDRLRALLAQACGKRVLVLGDCMLDQYLWGRATRISPEAPVLVVEQAATTYAPGGAGNAAANIAALGGEAILVSLVGEDRPGERLQDELERRGVCRQNLLPQLYRPTTIKTRIMAQGRQVLRVDREERTPVSAATAAALIEGFRRELARADAVLLSDYGKGLLIPAVVAAVVEGAQAAGRPVFANPKPSSIGCYVGLSLVSLNQVEAEAVTGLCLSGWGAVEQAGERLLQLCTAEAVIITLGERGLALFQAAGPSRHLPAVPLEVYDPCGCGDSAIAAAALARAAGADWEEAAVLANLAGAAKARKLGVAPVPPGDIAAVQALTRAGGPGSRPSPESDLPRDTRPGRAADLAVSQRD
jgi:rfaE bifunctional protein kinase chain/domain